MWNSSQEKIKTLIIELNSSEHHLKCLQDLNDACNHKITIQQQKMEDMMVEIQELKGRILQQSPE